MTNWSSRSPEERALLNPSFCSVLIWFAARSCVRDYAPAMSLEESFLVLPFVLHRETRDSLPRSHQTSVAVWLEEHALARGQIARRARLLVPFTREALLFGGRHGILDLTTGRTVAEESPRYIARLRRMLRETSDEVRACGRKADFVGKWFALTGNPATVFALLGVRP